VDRETYLGAPRAATVTRVRRAMVRGHVQPSVAARCRCLARFASGLGPTVELEHDDGRRRVDGAWGRL
jgi:hypothetical protein